MATNNIFFRFWKFLIKSAAWKYVVLFAAFLSACLTLGFIYGISGPLTIAQSKYFNISMGDSSWTSASMLACYECAASGAAILTRVFSMRTVQMVGTTVILLAMSLSFLATDYIQTIVLLGLQTGLGMSLVRNAACGVVREHFEDDMINFALTVVQAGIYLGIIIFSTLGNFLFNQFVFKQAVLILTTCMSVQCLIAVVYTKPDVHVEQKEIKEEPDDRTPTNIVNTAREVVADFRVWCFSVAGFCREFAMVAFFDFLADYMVEEKVLTLDQATAGVALVGYIGAGGVVFLCSTYKLTYNRVIPHIIAPIIYGTVMILVTEARSQEVYMLLMTVFGFTNGVHVGNQLSVANQLGGKEKMLFIFSLDQSVQGIGALIGGPITGFLDDHFTKRGAMYLAGCIGIMSGLSALCIFLYDGIKTNKDKISTPKILILNKNKKAVNFQCVTEEMQPLVTAQYMQDNKRTNCIPQITSDSDSDSVTPF